MDLAVIDSSLKDMTGVDAVAQLRHSTTAKRDIPVILLDSCRDHDLIRRARDAGVNEYVRKPFTAKTLLASVHSIIENPRPFILCNTYIGPDRRSNPAFSCVLSVPFLGQCRRRISPKMIGPGEQDSAGADVPARAFAPDGWLKRKMGLEAKDTFAIDEARVDVMEELLVSARETYARSVQEEVRELISYNRLLFQKPDRTAVTVEAIRRLAGAIEGKAADLGSPRVSEVARLLGEFCNLHFIPGSSQSLILLEKHALTLMALLQAGAKATSGQLGDTLVKDLARQVASLKLT